MAAARIAEAAHRETMSTKVTCHYQPSITMTSTPEFRRKASGPASRPSAVGDWLCVRRAAPRQAGCWPRLLAGRARPRRPPNSGPRPAAPGPGCNFLRTTRSRSRCPAGPARPVPARPGPARSASLQQRCINAPPTI